MFELFDQFDANNSNSSLGSGTNSQLQNSSETAVKLPIEQFYGPVAELVSKAKCDDLNTQLAEVQKMQIRHDFRIAVIGEFSHGKSYFLNKLLGIDLLTEGARPTTAVLTQIKNGSQPALLHLLPDRPPKSLEVSAQVLEQFIAEDNGNDPAGVLLLQLPIDWLNGYNISLFDTPGAGDLFGKRAQMTLEAIQSCDAVIMTIAASSPCSITEMAFLHDNVILKALPMTAILVTKLDWIAYHERQKVVEVIRNKVRHEVPEAKFWTILDSSELLPQAAQLFDATGIPAIRQAIVNMSTDVNLMRLRSVQAVTALKQIATQVQKSVQIQLDMLHVDAEQKRQKLQEVKLQVEGRKILWSQLQLTAQEEQLETIETISRSLETYQRKLFEELSSKLDSETFPIDWFEKDMPLYVQRRLGDICKNVEQEIVQKLLACQKKLLQESSQMFENAFEREEFTNFALTVPDSQISSLENLPTIQSFDFKQLADLFKMGVPILSKRPFGIALGKLLEQGIDLLANYIEQQEIAKQKEAIKMSLNNKLLDKIFSNLLENVRQYAQNGYDKIVSNIKSAAQKWQDIQLHAYEEATNANDNSPKTLEKLISESKQLIQNIDNYISI